jgi:hypothetical protein
MAAATLINLADSKAADQLDAFIDDKPFVGAHRTVIPGVDHEAISRAEKERALRYHRSLRHATTAA